LTLPETFVAAIGTRTFEVPRAACLDIFFSNRFLAADLSAMLERYGFALSQYAETASSAEAVWHAERI
jgi:hypothetical protein